MTDTNAKTISDEKTILVVEDEELLREMERSILEGSGYRVLEADSGDRALKLWNAEAGKIDLLLTDIVLPRGVSGMELAKELSAHKPGLKIIFTTGRATRDLDQEALGKLNARLLQKPYQQGDLIQMVKDVLKAP